MKSLLNLDVKLSYQMRLEKSRSRVFWFIAVFFAHSGDSWFWLAGLGLLWLAGGTEWHPVAALMILAILGLAVLVLGIKFKVRRSRPPGEWGAIYRNTDPHSFPSGHAARSMMLVVLAWGFGPTWFGLALTIWAPLVSVARVMMGVHYLSDVLAGALLGLTAGLVVFTLQPIIITILPFLFK